MMRKRLTKLLPLLLGFLIFSCSEFQEPQIDKEVVEVLTPRDSLRTSVSTQLFLWYAVPDAIDYELQIVSPGFDQIDRFVLDTIVTDTRFEQTLAPGTYQWSIRAFNNSSATLYTVHTLFIDSTIDLTTQTLQLIKPVDGEISNQPSKKFDWQKLYNADNYSFELWKPDESGQLIVQKSTTYDTLNYRVMAEGNYTWKVRGENLLTNTVFSSRSFMVDTTSPTIPVLLEPDTNAVINDTKVDFRWSRGTGQNTGSLITDTLFLASDINMLNKTHVIPTSATIEVIDTMSTGVYYWRVRSADAAGNSSNYSETRKLTIN